MKSMILKDILGFNSICNATKTLFTMSLHCIFDEELQ